MKRTRDAAPKPAPNDVNGALAALSADQLREVVGELLLALDDRAHSRALNSIIERAARGGSVWKPAALRDEDVADVLAFVNAAERIGQADSSDVDEYLRRGSNAFLLKNYVAAHQIFGALLRPIGGVR